MPEKKEIAWKGEGWYMWISESLAVLLEGSQGMGGEAVLLKIPSGARLWKYFKDIPVEDDLTVVFDTPIQGFGDTKNDTYT